MLIKLGEALRNRGLILLEYITLRSVFGYPANMLIWQNKCHFGDKVFVYRLSGGDMVVILYYIIWFLKTFL